MNERCFLTGARSLLNLSITEVPASGQPVTVGVILSCGLQPLMIQSGPMGQTIQRVQLGDPVDPNHRLFPKPCVSPLLAEVNHGQKEDTTRPGETEFQLGCLEEPRRL